MNHSKIVGTEFVMNHSKIVEKRSIEVGVIFGSNTSDQPLNDTSELEFDTAPFYTYVNDKYVIKSELKKNQN